MSRERNKIMIRILNSRLLTEQGEIFDKKVLRSLFIKVSEKENEWYRLLFLGRTLSWVKCPEPYYAPI